MKKKKKEPLSFFDTLRKIKHAGISGSVVPNRLPNDLNAIPSIEKRIEEVMRIINSQNRKPGNMLFFVMYDIEDNKVRYQIAKYLIKKGCTRVQKSIYLADLDNTKYNQIKDDLTEVQSLYDNEDSILIVPISTDLLNSMKVIGKTIDIDIITHSRNTLFF